MRRFYHLTIQLLFVSSMLSSGVFAQEMDLESLREEYLALTLQSDSTAAITGDIGKAKIAAGQEFIKNNPEELKSPEGKHFVKMHNQFVRMRFLKEKLDNCLSGDLDDPKYHNYLPKRIFDAALTLPDSDIPCDVAMFETADSLEELMASMSDVASSMTTQKAADDINDFQSTVHMQGLENALKTLVNLNYTYRDLGNQESISDDYINSQLLDKICSEEITNSGPGPRTRTRNKCTPEQKTALSAVAKREFNFLKASNADKYTAEEALNEIRDRIGKVNETIRGLEFDVNDNWIRDDINMESEKSQAAHQAYVSSFMSQTSGGPGMLMWTDAIGGRMGSRRDRDSDSLFGIIGGGFNPDTGTYKEHSAELSSNHVNEAINEAESRILEQTRNLMKKEDQRKSEHRRMDAGAAWYNSKLSFEDIVENRRDNLKELTGKNPILIGQSLMKDPSKVDEACVVINDIAQESKDNDGWTLGKVAMWGGAVVGGALLIATGVGALAALGGGAAMLGGATVTGAGLLTAAGVTFKGIAVAGFVYGVAESSVYGTRYIQAQNEKNEILAAYLAGGGDAQNADEFLQAMDDAQDAGWNAAVAVGFTVLDLPGAMAIARGLKNGPRASMRAYWDDLKEAMDMIANGRRLKGMIGNISQTLGKKETQRVLKQLLKQEKPNELLNKLRAMSDEDALELFRQGSKVCEEMCG